MTPCIKKHHGAKKSTLYHVRLSVETETPSKMVANHDKNAMLAALNAVFNGVFKMSLNFENLVETSSSLAQVVIKDGTFETKSLQRSSVETTKDDVARTIRSVFDLLGADVEQSGDYPGWEPNPDSSILKTMREMYVCKIMEEQRLVFFV